MPVKSPAMGVYDTKPNSYVLWLGAGLQKDSWDANLGGIYALSGDLGKSGWLLRAQGVYSAYRFPSALAASGTADGTFKSAGAALGYQFVAPSYSLAGFAGVDYRDNTTNPAAAATPGVGAQTGLWLAGRAALENNSRYAAELDGSFSTAYNTFWTRGRAGLKFGQITVGGELALLGDKFYNEARYGGYVAYNVSRHLIIEANAGYADVLRGGGATGSGGSGGYVELTLVYLH